MVIVVEFNDFRDIRQEGGNNLTKILTGTAFIET